MFKKITLLLMMMSSISLSALTIHHKEVRASDELQTETMKEDPFEQFQLWFKEAKGELGEKAAIAVLSTASKSGIPSGKGMVVKNIAQNDLTFFGDLRSRQFQDLAENPRGAVTFDWSDLQKQVTISGKMLPISEQEAYEVFQKRHKESQISSIASNQDEKIESLQELKDKRAAFKKEYEGKAIPMPKHWGGYRLVPERIEFWQAGPYNMHSRVVYEKTRKGWQRQMVSP